MDFTIRAEAIRWSLRNLSYRSFTDLLQECPHLRAAVSRGGFKLASNAFREPATVERLVNVISHDPEFARIVMLAAPTHNSRLNGLLAAYDLLAPEWLRVNWRLFFRALSDPRPWALACYNDQNHERLKRLGELLMGRPAFWQEPPAPDQKTSKSSPQEVAALQQALAFLQPQLCLPALPPEEPSEEPPPAEPQSMLPLTAAPAVASPVAGGAPLSRPLGLVPLVPGASVAAPPALSALTPLVAPSVGASSPSSAPNPRVGELALERDQLRKQLRISQKQQEDALAEKDHIIAGLQARLNEIQNSFEGALAELRADEAQAVREQVNTFEAITLGIHPDLETFAKTVMAADAPLGERVKQALQRQKETNRRYGTRQQLRDEVRKLDALLTQVKLAIDEAITVTPGLPDLQMELEQKIAEVRKQLREDAGEVENDLAVLPTRLSNYIREIPLTAEAFASFDAVQEMLDTSLGHKLLQGEERTKMLELLNRRRDLCRQALESLNACTGAVLSEKITGSMLQISQRSWFLEQFREVELYVDAYNVIKNDSYWTGIEKTPGGFSIARNDFIERCARKAAKLFKSITLVFDSDLPADTVEHRENNLTIVFAAKTTEDQNADNYIVEKLKRLDLEDEEKGIRQLRWLVTDDHQLRLRVAERCDAIVLDATFASFVKRS